MTTLALKKANLKFKLWLSVLAVLAAVGFLAIIIGFLRGHEVTYNTSTGVPWGILIPAYLFFVIPASGLCLLSSLGHVFGMKKYQALGKRAIFLAILLLLSGFLVIAADMERPWLMALYVLITPNPTSAIWWMGTLYAIYFIVLIVEFFFLSRIDAIRRLQTNQANIPVIVRILAMGAKRDSSSPPQNSMRLAKLSGTVGLVLAIAALSTLGGVFGLIGSRSLWHGPLLPVYFVLSSLLAGDAILIVATVLTSQAGVSKITGEMKSTLISLGRLLTLFLGIFLLFTVWNILTTQYGRIPEEFKSVMVLISGPLAVPFWVGEILLGLLIPAFILAYSRIESLGGITAASLLVILGIFIARYDFVIAGQLVPVVGREALWQYTPSVIEIVTVLGALALVLFLYSLGNHFLPLEELPNTSEP